ncbi:unnamed protein product [Adineta steineri]|uniref:Uncharacterized protein n=1 Tax=Adineta steineri TaxID=433720 RepID=A0A816BJ04_9BILA|nr:unnamed protein product [Adineta steineri]CAF1609815.1 unnamed protein product [Adineta steineri]
MTTKTSTSSRKTASKRFGNFTITCPDLTDEKKKQALIRRGCYEYIFVVRIEGYPDVQMVVKTISFIIENSTCETQEERQASTYTDLTTIQEVGSQNYPYIISYYGAVIDKVNYIFKESSKLLICVELMDVSMDIFYQTMHSFDNVTNTELDRVLCRLTDNVKYLIIQYIQ